VKKSFTWLLIIAFGIGVFMGAHWFPRIKEVKIPEIQIVQEPAPPPKIVYREIPADIELPVIHIPNPNEHPSTSDSKASEDLPSKEEIDLSGFQNAIASFDTTLKDHGKLAVWYHFPPDNYFDMDFDPEPLRTIVRTEIIKPAWYETRTFGLVTGALFTGAVVYLVKD